MFALVGTASRVPTAPTITVGSPTTSSLVITLSTRSVEPITGVTGYDILRGTSSGALSRIATNVAAASFPYTDASLAAGTIYYYALQGVDGSPNGYRSAASAAVSLATSNSGGGGGGTSAYLYMNAAGRIIDNKTGNPFMPRGFCLVGLEGQSIQGFHDTDPWGSGYSPNEPNWEFLAAQKVNFARLMLQAQSFAGYTCTELTGSGTGPYAWSGTTFSADPSGNYKACLLNAILKARSKGMYWIADFHISAPDVTIGGVTHHLGGIAQPPFMDQATGGPFWTSSNPQVGLFAQIASWFGSAALNSAYGYNGGVAGPYNDPTIGGPTGVQDGIFEFFNEPYFSNYGFTLTTQAGTFGTPAWRANNGGANYVCTNGGAPPATPAGSWFSGGPTGSDFVKLFGGNCNYFYANGTTGARGIPDGATGPGGQGASLNVSWPVLGYQQCLTGIRALGCQNICQVNGEGYASVLSSAPYWYPTDTMNPPQVCFGAHPYPASDGQTTSSTVVNTEDPNNGLPYPSTGAWHQWPIAIINGTNPIGHLPASSVIFTEVGTYSGPSATQPDPFLNTQIQNFIDAMPLGSCGVTFFSNQGTVAAGTGGLTEWVASIYGTAVSVTASLSGGIMNVTSGSGIPNTGTITNGVFNAAYGTYLLPFGSGGTTGTGGTGTYQVFQADGGALTQGAATLSIAAQQTFPGQSKTNCDWIRLHS